MDQNTCESNNLKLISNSVNKSQQSVNKKISRDNAYEQYLKNESLKMVAKWENTNEKLRQRKIFAQKEKTITEKANGLSNKIQYKFVKYVKFYFIYR